MGPWCTKVNDKGPQQLMHEAKFKSKNSELRYFAEDVNKRSIKKYYLLTSESFERLIQFNKINNLKNCFYEIMPSSCCTYTGDDKKACQHMLKTFGTRLYLDVEFPSDADFADFRMSQSDPLNIGKQIAVDVNTFLKKRLECDCELIVLKSHRPGKFSWHMIAVLKKDGVEHLFQDSLCVLTIINEWFETCDLEKYDYYKDDHKENAIDVSVYSTHKLYRTMQSSKFGKSTPLEFATYFPIRTDCNIAPEFCDTLCLQKLENRKLFNVEQSHSSTKLKSHVPSTTKRKATSQGRGPRKKHITTSFNVAAEMFFSNWEPWKEMKKFIVDKWPKVEFDKASYKSIFIVYLPLDYDFRCPLNKGSNNGKHKSNHSCLWVKPQVGLIEWRCQDLECKKKNVCKKVHFPFQLCNRLKKMYTHRFPVKLLDDSV